MRFPPRPRFFAGALLPSKFRVSERLLTPYFGTEFTIDLVGVRDETKNHRQVRETSRRGSRNRPLLRKARHSQATGRASGGLAGVWRRCARDDPLYQNRPADGIQAVGDRAPANEGGW